MMRYLAASCALACAVAATEAYGALTLEWVPNTISPAAITADPALAGMQSWSLLATNTDGHWASAGLRAVLPAGNTFYQVPAGRGGSDVHPNPAFFPVFPDLEFDTYVSSARNQLGQNPPSVLGAFPEDQPPVSFGGSGDAIPGTFAVAWGDAAATSGPGPGTYEIVRLTFPLGVIPEVLNNSPQPVPNHSRTSQVNPDQTVEIPDIPEPTTLGLAAAAGLLLARRRK